MQPMLNIITEGPRSQWLVSSANHRRLGIDCGFGDDWLVASMEEGGRYSSLWYSNVAPLLVSNWRLFKWGLP